MIVSAWGLLSQEEHNVINLLHRSNVHAAVNNTSNSIAYGNGRSYGDVCLNPGGSIWAIRKLDKFIAFDARTGQLTCEAGLLLRDIQQVFVRKGWMLPVTPGTQLATVGGAVANDVHGKNHHRAGSFGNHVIQLSLHRTDGSQIVCGPNKNADWFSATVGGLGLTGVISEVVLQLKKVKGPWLDVESIAYDNLDNFFALADESENDWEYTVAWIDCLSSQARGIFMRANHSVVPHHDHEQKPPIAMPFVPPISLVNQLTLSPFNFAYYHLNKFKSGRSVQHYEPFFYPLDNIQQWNKMYGKKGFYQYQFVVPRRAGKESVQMILKEIAYANQGSFLAVLKTFGNRESPGMLSFPQEGVTLALDFPNRGAITHALFKRLDHIVQEAQGRIYMAKDARMPRSIFEAGYPKLSKFINYRDPGISSAMSRRLMGK